MSTRSIWAIVLLLFGITVAHAEDQASATARGLFPRTLVGWSAGYVDVSQSVVNGRRAVVASRTYTMTRTKEQVTITIETYNPVLAAFIAGAGDYKGPTDPVTRAGMRKFEFGRYHGIASGPEENPDRVMLVIEGGGVVTIARQRGSSDALVSYLYYLDLRRIEAFARWLTPSAES